MSALRVVLMLLFACCMLGRPAQAVASPSAHAHAHAVHARAAHLHDEHAHEAHVAPPAYGAIAKTPEAVACPEYSRPGATHGGHGHAGGCCDPATGNCAGACAHGVPALHASTPIGACDMQGGQPVARLRAAHRPPPPAPLLRPPIA